MSLGIDQQEKIVEAANSILGKPYLFGASHEDKGKDKLPRNLDCLSFVKFIFSAIDVVPGNTLLLQAANPKAEEIVPEADYSNLETGDLMFFRGTKGRYDLSQFQGRDILVGHVALFVTSPYRSEPTLYSARQRFGSVLAQPLQEVLAETYFNTPTIIKRF